MKSYNTEIRLLIKCLLSNDIGGITINDIGNGVEANDSFVLKFQFPFRDEPVNDS